MKVKKERVAIVTGGSYGIGKTCAVALAKSGIHVAILSRKREEGLIAVKDLNKFSSKALHIETDVSDREQVRESVSQVVTEFDGIDILVNNAGMVSPLKYFFDQSDDDWDLILKVHLYGAFYMMKEVAPIMMRKKYGRIVNISSTAAHSGSCGRANYVAAKSGIEGLTLTAAQELAEFGITVNAVRPGFTVTALTKARGYNFDALAKIIPRKRVGTVDDTARVVEFLVAEESDFITGQIISVDGGLSLSGAGIINALAPLKS
jgi:3-oxoacyl-[acyl-carrier protein] reductase